MDRFLRILLHETNQMLGQLDQDATSIHILNVLKRSIERYLVDETGSAPGSLNRSLEDIYARLTRLELGGPIL